MFTAAGEISQLLSVPKEEIADGVTKLNEALAKERADFKTYRLSSAKARAAAIEPTSGNLVLYFADLEGEELRVLASEAMSAVDGILVVLGGPDGVYKYVIASNSTDLRAASRDINAALGGRGGGSPTMIQGSFTADLDAIKSYFEAK
jgi:alanyl-tRNA synthetase